MYYIFSGTSFTGFPLSMQFLIACSMQTWTRQCLPTWRYKRWRGLKEVEVFCYYGECPGTTVLNVHKVEKVFEDEENVEIP